MKKEKKLNEREEKVARSHQGKISMSAKKWFFKYKTRRKIKTGKKTR